MFPLTSAVPPRRAVIRVLSISAVATLVISLQALIGPKLVACPSAEAASLPVTEPGINQIPMPRAAALTTGELLRQNVARRTDVDPNSPAMIADLAQVVAARGMVVSTSEWTVPAYFVDASTPRVNVRVNGRPPGANLDKTFVHDVVSTMVNVPIPANAKSDPLDDGHMTVVDTASGCEYDFYGARKTKTGWVAEWGNAIEVPSSGVYRNGLSSRASGFSPLAGLIWPEELKAGRIDHALVFNYPHTKLGGPVAPATASDGKTPGPGAIPEGALLRLDPTLNLATLKLNRTELILARAMQQYGMYLVDTGGVMGFYAVSAISQPAGAYKGMLELPYHGLKGIPAQRMQVMKLPPQQPVTPLKVTPSKCTTPPAGSQSGTSSNIALVSQMRADGCPAGNCPARAMRFTPVDFNARGR